MGIYSIALHSLRLILVTELTLMLDVLLITDQTKGVKHKFLIGISQTAKCPHLMGVTKTYKVPAELAQLYETALLAQISVAVSFRVGQIPG